MKKVWLIDYSYGDMLIGYIWLYRVYTCLYQLIKRITMNHHSMGLDLGISHRYRQQLVMSSAVSNTQPLPADSELTTQSR